MRFGTQYAAEVWVEDGRLCVEQAKQGTERSATADMALAADILRNGQRARVVASPGFVARLAGYLINSGHVRP